MSQSIATVVLPVVSEIDIEELQHELPAACIEQIGAADHDPDAHNELATVLALTLTPVVVSAITFWLVRTVKKETIEYRVLLRKPDGTEKEVWLKIVRSSSEAPDAQVIKQIAAALDVPVSDILSAQG